MHTAERANVDFSEGGAKVVESILEQNPAIEDYPLAKVSEATKTVVQMPTKSVEEHLADLNKAAQGEVAAQKNMPEKRASKLPEILEKISDPQFSKPDVARLIAWEMVSILSYLDSMDDSGKDIRSKILLEQLKGVRELGRQLIDADDANQDYINFDGPKFKHVMDHWFETAKKSLREIGFDDHTVTNFIMHWSEELGKSEIKLRREVTEIK
jgi:hypothetical protein